MRCLKQPTSSVIGTMRLFLLPLSPMAQGQQYRVIHGYRGGYSRLTPAGETYLGTDVKGFFSLQYSDWLYDTLFLLTKYGIRDGYWFWTRSLSTARGA